MYFLQSKNYLYPLIDGSTITIGRNKENMIQVNFIEMSRFHAQIHITGNKVMLKDLNTSNGTFLVDQKIFTKREFEIKIGDVIGFGQPAKVDTIHTFQLVKLYDPDVDCGDLADINLNGNVLIWKRDVEPNVDLINQNKENKVDYEIGKILDPDSTNNEDYKMDVNTGELGKLKFFPKQSSCSDSKEASEELPAKSPNLYAFYGKQKNLIPGKGTQNRDFNTVLNPSNCDDKVESCASNYNSIIIEENSSSADLFIESAALKNKSLKAPLLEEKETFNCNKEFGSKQLKKQIDECNEKTNPVIDSEVQISKSTNLLPDFSDLKNKKKGPFELKKSGSNSNGKNCSETSKEQDYKFIKVTSTAGVNVKQSNERNSEGLDSDNLAIDSEVQLSKSTNLSPEFPDLKNKKKGPFELKKPGSNNNAKNCLEMSRGQDKVTKITSTAGVNVKQSNERNSEGLDTDNLAIDSEVQFSKPADLSPEFSNLKNKNKVPFEMKKTGSNNKRKNCSEMLRENDNVGRITSTTGVNARQNNGRKFEGLDVGNLCNELSDKNRSTKDLPLKKKKADVRWKEKNCPEEFVKRDECITITSPINTNVEQNSENNHKNVNNNLHLPIRKEKKVIHHKEKHVSKDSTKSSNKCVSKRNPIIDVCANEKAESIKIKSVSFCDELCDKDKKNMEKLRLKQKKHVHSSEKNNSNSHIKRKSGHGIDTKNPINDKNKKENIRDGHKRKIVKNNAENIIGAVNSDCDKLHVRSNPKKLTVENDAKIKKPEVKCDTLINQPRSVIKSVSQPRTKCDLNKASKKLNVSFTDTVTKVPDCLNISFVSDQPPIKNVIDYLSCTTNVQELTKSSPKDGSGDMIVKSPIPTDEVAKIKENIICPVTLINDSVAIKDEKDDKSLINKFQPYSNEDEIIVLSGSDDENDISIVPPFSSSQEIKVENELFRDFIDIIKVENSDYDEWSEPLSQFDLITNVDALKSEQSDSDDEEPICRKLRPKWKRLVKNVNSDSDESDALHDEESACRQLRSKWGVAKARSDSEKSEIEDEITYKELYSLKPFQIIMDKLEETRLSNMKLSASIKNQTTSKKNAEIILDELTEPTSSNMELVASVENQTASKKNTEIILDKPTDPTSSNMEPVASVENLTTSKKSAEIISDKYADPTLSNAELVAAVENQTSPKNRSEMFLKEKVVPSFHLVPTCIEKSKIKSSTKNRGAFLLDIPETTNQPKRRRIQSSILPTNQIKNTMENSKEFERLRCKSNKVNNEMMDHDCKSRTLIDNNTNDISSKIFPGNKNNLVQCTNSNYPTKDCKMINAPRKRIAPDNKKNVVSPHACRGLENFKILKTSCTEPKKRKGGKRVGFNLVSNKIHQIERSRHQNESPESLPFKRPTFYFNMVSEMTSSVEEAICRICKWNVAWLNQQTERSPPPPVYEITDKNNFSQQISYLLFLELWGMLYNFWRESADNALPLTQYMTDRTYMHHITIETIIKQSGNNLNKKTKVPELPITFGCTNLWTIQAYRALGFDETHQNRRIRSGQLVILNLKIMGANNDGTSRTMLFAYVCEDRIIPIENLDRTKYNLNIYENTKAVQRLRLKIPQRSFDILPGSTVKIRGMISIQGPLRPFMAFPLMKHCSLSPAITQPDLYDFSVEKCSTELDPVLDKYLSASQKSAVTMCLDICESKKPNICIVDGPAGGGKTQVIVSFVMQYFTKINQDMEDGDFKDNSTSKQRILIITNTDIESHDLVARIQRANKKLPGDYKNINVVYYGRILNFHQAVPQPSVLECNVENIVNKMIQNDNDDLLSYKEQINYFQAKINSCETALQSQQARSDIRLRIESQLKYYKQEHAAMLLDKGKFCARFNYDKREVAYKKVLDNADVVVTTFQSCWYSEAETLFVPSYANKGDITRFSTCIFEDAAANSEIYSLIPILFRIQHLILIGDSCGVFNSKQVSLTFLKKSNGNSIKWIYERLMKCKSACPPPVVVLKNQFSMHPEIFAWPSRFFYSDLSCTTKYIVNENDPYYRLRPYIVIDHCYVSDALTREISNDDEADLITQMIKMINVTFPDQPNKLNIGIIVPNRAQADTFRPILESIRVIKRHPVTIDLVTEFLGRLYDMIFVSLNDCIPVINDPVWLNRAITRARKSLIICGNFTNLKSLPMYSSLYVDAIHRHVMVKIGCHTSDLTEDYLRNIILNRR